MRTLHTNLFIPVHPCKVTQSLRLLLREGIIGCTTLACLAAVITRRWLLFEGTLYRSWDLWRSERGD